jgi:hypothetical protein
LLLAHFVRDASLSASQILIWIKSPNLVIFFHGFGRKHCGGAVMTTLKTMAMAAVLLVASASLAMAQNGPPTGGEYPVAGGAAGGYPGYGYGNGYAAAPLYDYAAPTSGYAAPVADLAQPGYGYAAPGYVAPAQAGTTIIIVMAPAHRGRSVYAAPQVYTAPPVTTGYYGAAVSQPIYAYAPGYGYGYTPGYWNRGYWGRYGYGWR